MKIGWKRMRKKWILTTIILLLLGLCAACGRGEESTKGRKRAVPGEAVSLTKIPTAQPTASSSPTPTSTPTPTPDPLLLRKLSEVYPAAEYLEDLYYVDSPWRPEGGYLFGGQVRDGYILLEINPESWEYDSVRYSLFPILAPERTVRGSVPYATGYSLGTNGTVYAWRNGGELIQRKVDRETDAVWDFGSDVSFIGESEDGTAWVAGDGFLAGYNFETMHEERYEGFKQQYDDRILSEDGDTILFALHTSGGRYQLFRLNRKEGGIYPVNTPGHAEFYDETIVYDSGDRFYTASFENPDDMVSFEKKRQSESIVMCRNGRMMTYCYERDESGENFIDYYRIVDIETGAEIAEVRTDLFLDRYWTAQYIGLSEEQFVFALYGDGEVEDLYLYDFSKKDTEFNPTLLSYCPEAEQPEAYRIARRMEDEYPGIHVYYDSFGLGFFRESYLLETCTDEGTLIDYMLAMEQFLGEYPDGFFIELAGEEKGGLDIYLCGGFIRINDSSIAVPAGCANRYGQRLSLCLDVHYLSSMEQNTVHELMHLSEHRITEYEKKNGCGILAYWDEKLNSPSCPFASGYLDANGEMISDYSGTVYYDAASAWFIDAYSKSAPTEDRARVLEYLFCDERWMFNGEHLSAKARFLSAALREVFPSIAACEEPVLWERMFGICSFDEYRDLVKNPEEGTED